MNGLTSGQGFQRCKRLSDPDLRLCIQQGNKVFNQGHLIYRKKNLLPYSRFAVIIPKKMVASSVNRNLLKRFHRFSFRTRQWCFVGFDLVLLIKTRHLPSFKEISQLWDTISQQKERCCS